jgi:iron complex outermembrane receptor protein
MHKMLLTLFLLCVKLVFAQQNTAECKYTLSGKVIDEHNYEALPFATILIKGTQNATLSDSSGFFTFHNLCEGKYTLISSHLDCENVEYELILAKSTEIVIHQEHHAKELHQLTITAKRNQIIQSQNISSLSSRQIEASKGKALGEMLKSIAGVNSLQTGNSISKPVIHGLHSNRIIIMNNGVRQEGQQWGSEHGPEIDPFVADKIAVIKGAAGVRYGPDAIAGVVLIEPNALRDSSGFDGIINMVGNTNAGQGAASGIINGNIKQLNGLNFRLQGTVKQAGNSKAPDYYLKNTGFHEKNFSAAMGYQKTYFGSEIFYSKFNSKLGILSAAHIGNITDLENAINNKVPSELAGFTYEIQRPYQLIVHDLIKWKSYINFNKAGKLTYTLSRQRNDRSEYDKHGPRNDSLAALNKPELNFIINTLIHELVYDIKLAKRFNTQVGYTSMHQSNSYEGRFFIPNFNNKAWGAFLIENYKKNNFFAEAGVRYDERRLRVFIEKNGFINQPLFAFNKLSGLLGTGYHFKNHDIKFNIGTGWRAPAVNELYANGVHHGAAAVEIGDKDLLPESNINTSFWWGINPLNKISGEIEFYQNAIQNFIYLIPVQPATQTIRGAFPTFKYKQVNALLSGADLQLKYTIFSAWQLNVKASYLYAVNQDTKLRLTQMPQNLVEPSILWEPKLKSDKWSSFYLKISYLIVARAVLVETDEDYLAPPPAYQLLNAEAGVNCKIKQQTINMGITINNALNTSYRSYLNRYRYFADDMGSNLSIHLKIPIHFKTNNNEKK